MRLDNSGETVQGLPVTSRPPISEEKGAIGPDFGDFDDLTRPTVFHIKADRNLRNAY